MAAKIDRHYYYQSLKDNNDLFRDKTWLIEAMKCTLERHAGWVVSLGSLNKIVSDPKYTIDDFLDFISMNNKVIAADLRELEGVDEYGVKR